MLTKLPNKAMIIKKMEQRLMLQLGDIE